MLDTECRVLCRVVTQDGVIVENSSTKTFTSVPLPDERPTICNCKINYKDCTVDISHGNYVEIIQREDMKTGEIKTLVSGTLLAQDWFAASNKTYRYRVLLHFFTSVRFKIKQRFMDTSLLSKAICT